MPDVGRVGAGDEGMRLSVEERHAGALGDTAGGEVFGCFRDGERRLIEGFEPEAGYGEACFRGVALALEGKADPEAAIGRCCGL